MGARAALEATGTLDDASLVEAAQGGDPGAFAQLYARYREGVFRACLRRLRDVHDADEVAQAAFVRAFERIGQCQGERRFGAWVHVIAQRLCVDLQRSRSRLSVLDDPLGEGPSDQPGPEERALDRELARQVRAAIARLPGRQGRAVAAADLEGRPSGEIAAAMGVSVGAVDSLLHRARRNLAASLKQAAANGTLGSAHVGPAVVATGAVAAAARVARALGDLGRGGSRGGGRLWAALQPVFEPFGREGLGRAAAGVAAALLAAGGLALGGSASFEHPSIPASAPASSQHAGAPELLSRLPAGLVAPQGLPPASPAAVGKVDVPSTALPPLAPGAVRPSVSSPSVPDPSGPAQASATKARSSTWAALSPVLESTGSAVSSAVSGVSSAVSGVTSALGAAGSSAAGGLAAAAGQVTSGLGPLEGQALGPLAAVTSRVGISLAGTPAPAPPGAVSVPGTVPGAVSPPGAGTSAATSGGVLGRLAGG